MKLVNAHRGRSPVTRSLTRPLYGMAMRRVVKAAQKNLVSGRASLTLPNGEILIADTGEEGPQAEIIVNDYQGIWMVLTAGDLGFADAYIAGHLDTPELKNVLDLAVANETWFARLMNNRGLSALLNWVVHALNDNSKAGSRKNIFAHYDLGNDFYGEWLDRSMTYSSAVFKDVTTSNEDLYSAQQNKYRRIIEIGEITPEHNVLEIGCGWGGFAEYAAKHVGCKVTGVTISQAQYDFAAKRLQQEGLNEKVELRIQDYRDIEPSVFDRVASIEMFEAGGEKHWPHFFGKVRDVLKPGGRASMQIITIADDLFDHYRSGVDFIQKYIFPGGMLPRIAKLREVSQAHGLEIDRNDGFRLDYARTLLEWNDAFQKKWPKLNHGKFDEQFRRMWEYYLKYCAAGFEAGRIDVRQIAWGRD